jgi:excisionase family DNA binding protein
MTDDVLSYCPDDACRVLGIGKSKFYQLTRAGIIPIRKFGRRSLVLRSDLSQWLESLATKPTANRRPIIPRKRPEALTVA